MKNTEVHIGMVVQFVGEDYDSREQAKQGLSFNVGTITELLTRDPQTREFAETAPRQKPTHVTVGQVRHMTDPRHTTWRVLPPHTCPRHTASICSSTSGHPSGKPQLWPAAAELLAATAGGLTMNNEPVRRGVQLQVWIRGLCVIATMVALGAASTAALTTVSTRVPLWLGLTAEVLSLVGIIFVGGVLHALLMGYRPANPADYQRLWHSTGADTPEITILDPAHCRPLARMRFTRRPWLPGARAVYFFPDEPNAGQLGINVLSAVSAPQGCATYCRWCPSHNRGRSVCPSTSTHSGTTLTSCTTAAILSSCTKSEL